MEFRLLFKGAIKSQGAGPEVHEIRRMLHPQLKQLWSNHAMLQAVVRQYGLSAGSVSDDDSIQRGIDALAESHYDLRFLPLVADDRFVRCELDILFLRREQPGRVFMKGDIDNRLKTLFDALRIPDAKEQVRNHVPSDGENPLYVLLTDDKLVTDLKVSTDQLLMLPGEIYDSNQVFLVIRVKLQPYQPSPWQRAMM